MGLDAFVACRCWELGQTPPAPVPVELDPETRRVEVVDWERDGQRFNQWQLTACPHGDRDMELVTERVGNWSGVRTFGWLLVYAARGLCPQLIGEWTHVGNGGAVSAEAAEAMLNEVDRLVSLPLTVVRVETGDNEVWCDYGPDMINQVPVLLFDDFSADIVDLSGRMSIQEQGEHIAWCNSLTLDRLGDVWTVTAEGPGTFEVSAGSWSKEEIPRMLGSRAIEVAFADYQPHIVAVLRRLFAAAVESGNPVCWC